MFVPLMQRCLWDAGKIRRFYVITYGVHFWVDVSFFYFQKSAIPIIIRLMSYEVTATRRRPQQFDDLVGQEFVAETLKNSIKSGKIAHAYLFSGPRGGGKTSTARILAKALNCQNGPTDIPCGTCSNCQEITKGTSLDVIEIDGASNTSVENIRQIKDEVLFPPSNCKYKIYIIDEVHMLSTSAFNALLKTIEEPPPYVIFIFATTELQKVPATIKSRCQQFNFRLVAIDKVKQCLAEAAAELNIQADDEALFWIARESTGSMRDAYTLFDQVVAFSDGHITYEKIRDKLGLVGIDRLNTVFEACAQNKTAEVLNLLDEFLQAGVSIEQLISNCADYLRSLLLIKSGVKKESLLGNSPERYSSVVLGAWSTVQIERALSVYLQLYRDIRYSVSPRYELELAFSRLCWLSEFVSNAEVKKAIDAAQNLLAGAASTPVSQVNQTSQQPAQLSQPVQTQPIQSQQPDFQQNQQNSQNQTQKTNSVPNGLPRLSMLDTLIEQEANGGGGEAGGGENPFHDGGLLPPEQSVAAQQAENKQPAELDERLKLHIPQENVSEEGVVVPTVDIPLSADGYSENPDIEDDGWSNMDAPPEDEYYPDEEELADRAEEAYEISTAPLSGSKVSAQLQETFEKADGTTISIAQLRGQVTANLSVSDGFAASTLEKTGLWIVENDSVTTTVDTSYDLGLIEKKNSVIAAEISNACGRLMKFNVTLKKEEPQKPEEKVQIPLQVEILVNAFKGRIVAGRI